ncbi:hypothetical protein NLX85_16330 [Micromonospora sp. A3M-1-15]|uniref:hypothetical protein n=1 Tax=Micromonospora sp. A3M-1-15 TaxID=2962035 RepID=UPI0020B78C2C|nr:hypothetical protein [Micromonospora sp. A3M-1-15]MCP3784937.1 hypothetical protein [Micromonospora sp. A3M-1-15]
MAVVRAFERDDYSPEYGLVVLRDPGGFGVPGDAAELPRERDRGDEPTGTFAGAGAGWITCQAGDGYHVVRLELHDGPPPDDHAGFDDVLETPYRARSGGLSLTMLTGGAGQTDLDLGDAGTYRVRVACRRGDTEDGFGDRWLLRFWPDPAPAPPVWLARARPAVGPGYDGWQLELQYAPMELAGIVNAAAREHGGPVTVEHVDEWCRAHQRPPGWLDAPLWQPPREPLTTGHADLDTRNAAQHAEVVARLAGQQRRLDEIAAELGVPPVRRRRDVLPLLAAAGILVREGPDGYRAGRPARVDTVLSLPPDRVRAVRLQDDRARYGRLADDLEAVLRWFPGAPLEVTAAKLAGRLLVSEAELRDGLAFAERTGLLHVDGDEDQPLRLWLGRRSSAAPAARTAPDATKPAARTAPAATKPTARTAPAASAAAPMRAGPAPNPGGPPTGAFGLRAIARSTGETTHGRARFVTFLRHNREERPGPPFGAPPRAGVVEANGTVVEWRDGGRVELARLPAAHWSRALQTRHGVLVTGLGHPARLVSAAGEVTEIDEVRMPGVALLDGGRRVAVVDAEHHRRVIRYRLRVVDLAGGPVETMPWPEDQVIHLLGAYRGQVFFGDQSEGRRATMRWTPGSAPERHAYTVDQVDPLSGTGSVRTAQGVAVVKQDGTTVTVPVDLTARLAPGGDRLWSVRREPPALTLFPVEPGAGAQPQVWWLAQEDRRMPQGMYREPIWEDTGHVLFGYQLWHSPRDPAGGVRLSVRDGAVERLPASGPPGQPAMFVEPLLTP